jgi:hypothetical protein
MEPSKQLQSYLPGMGVNSDIGRQSRAVKEPHQMTPEEFSSAPNAVFHTAHGERNNNLLGASGMEARREDFESGIGFSPHVHVGTEQAALENGARTVGMDHDDYDPVLKRERPPRLHTFHYTAQPGDSFHKHHDGEVYTKPEYGDTHPDVLAEKFPDYDSDRAGRAGDFDPKYEYSHDIHDKPALFYKNVGEDEGSTSISVADVSRLKSHGDYVRNAIANGKGDEVHPVTMQMYKEGRLDKGAYLPHGFVERVSRNAGNNLHLDVHPGHDGPGLGPLSLNGMSEEDAKTTQKAFGMPNEPEYLAQRAVRHREPTEKYSDKGPDYNYIKRQAEGR